VHEHILAAVIADDESESLLRIEELDDALAFANDLRRHAAPAGAAKTATATAGESAAVASTVAAATIAAAESAAVAIRPLTESAALSESAAIAGAFFEEPVALVSSATAAVAPTPSIETHTD